eukprot:scaffold32705_cov54-Phaeocystis_antarctica.AAC.2
MAASALAAPPTYSLSSCLRTHGEHDSHRTEAAQQGDPGGAAHDALALKRGLSALSRRCRRVQVGGGHVEESEEVDRAVAERRGGPKRSELRGAGAGERGESDGRGVDEREERGVQPQPEGRDRKAADRLRVRCAARAGAARMKLRRELWHGGRSKGVSCAAAEQHQGSPRRHFRADVHRCFASSKGVFAKFRVGGATADCAQK